MPINSFNDIDNMITAYKSSRQPTTRSHSDLASGYWGSNSQCPDVEGTYNRSSSSSSPASSPTTPKSPSYLSRACRIIGVRDIFDENGFFNSSQQLMK
jgi:hypothetical protein